MRKLVSQSILFAAVAAFSVAAAGCSQYNGLKAKRTFRDANGLYQSSDYKAAAAKYEQVVKLLHFVQGPRFPNGYRAISTEVTSFPTGPFTHSLTIAAGSADGVRLSSPVVSGDGLVGIVSNVFPDSAKVTLISDSNSYVAARDLQTRVRGGVRTGAGGTLILDLVQKTEVVKQGDQIVTDGTHNARLPDLYPYGIPIGRVTSVGVADTASFLQVQVQPFANLGSLDTVAVLVPTKHR